MNNKTIKEKLEAIDHQVFYITEHEVQMKRMHYEWLIKQAEKVEVLESKLRNSVFTDTQRVKK